MVSFSGTQHLKFDMKDEEEKIKENRIRVKRKIKIKIDHLNKT